MPELPEVQTTASGLHSVLPGLKIVDIWNDYKSSYFKGKDNIKDPNFFKYFKKEILNKEIISVNRRAKNVLINLSDNKTILIHMKMTGHLLYGDYDKNDPYNRFIRLIFNLSNGKTLELCDTRRFAKVSLIPTDTLHLSDHLKDIGPEPLEKSFSFKKFLHCLNKKSNGKIKLVLMDQTIIAGIGNIYADESLCRSSIDPRSIVNKIPEDKMKDLYNAIKTTLKKGIDFGGDSMSDYRNIHGKRGKFQEQHMVYKRKGKNCLIKNCDGIIERIVLGTRSTHYCNKHQKLSK
jgi:formamidopyrimidine-DNA glycosylase